MKKHSILIALLFVALMSGCRAIQPILVLHPKDLFFLPLIYLILCFVFAKILSEKENKFWMWFILNLVFTPILGLFIMIHRLTK